MEQAVASAKSVYEVRQEQYTAWYDMHPTRWLASGQAIPTILYSPQSHVTLNSTLPLGYVTKVYALITENYNVVIRSPVCMYQCTCTWEILSKMCIRDSIKGVSIINLSAQWIVCCNLNITYRCSTQTIVLYINHTIFTLAKACRYVFFFLFKCNKNIPLPFYRNK